ncbi:MAG TPA: ABC transporter permease [Candidatus Alistipes merdigallinarum]|nr:ABC transporter permease [Candidatus Alistipes merdigallinarum]
MIEPENIRDQRSAEESSAPSLREETTSEEAAVKEPSRFERYVKQILSGSILTNAEVQKHYPYILFMVLLAFLYIANGFHMQKLHRQHDRLTAQVKELRARSLTLSSQRMIATRQSEIIRAVEERGIPLEELLAPPKIIDK